MKIGYARVSTQDQKLDLQVDALQNAGCEKIFQEKASGKNNERPELIRMMEQLRKNDILIIWKLDRLGRSLKNLIEIVSELQNMGVELISIQDNVNTSTATGKLTFAIFGALAEFERDIIRERTKAGLAAARARGKRGGRKNVLNDKQVQILKSLSVNNSLSVGEICKQLGISKGTYYNYLNRANTMIKG